MTRHSFRVLRPCGFSLVELLVVIAIIASLLALLLPSLSASRANSKSLLCLSNERQFYGVFNQYAYDNKQMIPYMSYYWHTLATGKYLLTGETYAGAANGLRYRLFKCPDDPGGVCAGDPSGLAKPMYDNPWLPSAYAMNMTMNWGTWNVGARTQSRLGERSIDCRPNWGTSLYVKSVSDLTFMMDAPTWIWGWDQAWYTWNVDNATQLDLGANKYRYAFRHPNATANVLFMDGHAASTKHYMATSKYLFGWKYP